MVEAGAGIIEPAVEIDWGPVYELVLGLLVFSWEPAASTMDAGPGWFKSIRERASPGLLSAIQELAPRCWLWLRLLVLATAMHNRKLPIQFEEFVQRLKATEPWRLYLDLMGANHSRAGPVTSALVQKAILGDRAARLTIGRVLFPDDPDEDAPLERLLTLSPHRVKDLIVQITSRWYSELFRERESEIVALLSAEARTKRAIGQTSLDRLLPAAAPGFHYVPRRMIRRVLLIPSLICRPFVVTTRFGSSRVFFYPISDEPAEGDATSAQLVKVHRALADGERLRILRALIPREGTLNGLSRELELPVPRVSAHLVVLRNAGLVTLRMDEQRTTYAIRKNLASMVYRTLHAFLPERGTTLTRRLA